MRFDAILYDMDGLLVDTERLALLAWVEACRELEILSDVEDFKPMIGRNGAGIRAYCLERYGRSFPADQAFARSDEIYHGLIDACPRLAKPGVEESISAGEALGMALGVCSSSSCRKIEYKLTKIGVFGRMRQIVGGDEVGSGKPHPEPYLLLARKLGIDPARCLALEDSYNGIRSASAAGMSVAMIPDLLPPTDEMRGLCCAIIESLLDVEKLLVT